MKKSFLFSMCAVVISTVLITSCGSKAKGNLNLPPVNVETVKDSTEFFDISVDPRLELIGIIARLAGYENFNNPEWNSEKPVAFMDTWFEKYKNEPAVKTAASFKKKIKYQDCFVVLADYIKPDFSGTLRDLNEMPEELKKQWGKVTPAQIEKFIIQINALAQKCDLNRICVMNKASYIAYVADYKTIISIGKSDDKIKAEDWLKDFYKGYKPGKITLYVSSLLNGCSYYYIFSDTGSQQKTLYCSPYRSAWGIVSLAEVTYARCFINDSWNEIGPQCEELFTKYKVANNITADLDLKNQLSWILADVWGTDFIRKYWDEDERDNYINESKNYYMLNQLDDLIKITDEYVQNPDKYKDVSELLPEYKKVIESF